MTSQDKTPNASQPDAEGDVSPRVDEQSAAKQYGATEYVVIAALILVVLIGAITLLGERTSGIEEPPPAALPAP